MFEGGLMCLHGSRRFALELITPAAARQFCRDHLHPAILEQSAAAELVNAAEAVVSELATNALAAGGAESIDVDLMLHHTFLHISVWDDGEGLPALRSPPPSDTHGRGLRIVDALTTAWGVLFHDGGKRVWADVQVPGGAVGAFFCNVPAI
jgi:anti-sigma regulatory factor (Ser/Thr protein kinase)